MGIIATRDRTHVFHLFVARSHQGRGIARELWRRARERARAASRDEVFSVNSSLIAEPVYRRFGFERVSGPIRESGIELVPMRYPAGDSIA